MRRLLNRAFGLLMKITSFPRLCCADGVAGDVVGDGQPRIYIENSTCSRDAVATLSALGKKRTCLLVSESEYCSDRVLRTLSPRRTIIAAGGLNTEWVHTALRRLRNGESILFFPEKRADGANVTELNPAFILLSIMSGAEIVPLHNAPKRRLFRVQNITAGRPIRPDTNSLLTSAFLKRESERARSEMALLSGM